MSYLQRLKEKLENINNRNSNRKSKDGIFDMRAGEPVSTDPNTYEHNVRVVPTSLDPDKNNPVVEVFMHYNLNVPGFPCLKRNFGKPCPACEFGHALWLEYLEDKTEPKKKEAMTFFAKGRFFSPVVSRDEDNKTVEGSVPSWMSYNNTQAKAFVEWGLKKKIGDVMDPYEGKDLNVTHQLPKTKQEFAKTTFMYDPTSSPLAESEEDIQALIDQIPDLYEVIGVKTFEEVDEIVRNFVNRDPDGGLTESKYGSSETVDDEVHAAFKELRGE